MKIKIRNLRYILFPALLLLIPCSFLRAQTVTYFLEWQEDHKAGRYEVVIEKEEDNEYRQASKKPAKTSSIEVSLEPGKYRYRVIPYNHLDRPGNSSDWKEFEVRAAASPELYDFSPSVFNVDTTVYELTATGKNLNSETKIYLRHIGGAVVVPNDKKAILPADKEFNEDGSVRLFFHNNQLIPGDYEIVAINPGQMETSREGFTIVPFQSDEQPQEIPNRWYDHIYIGMGMYFPVMGMYWDEFFDQSSFPGFMLHLRFVIYQKDLFSIDLGFKFSRYALRAGSGNYYFMYDPVSLLMRVWMPSRSIAFGIRPGLGFLAPLSYDEAEDNGMRNHHVNLDLSVWFALGKRSFLEIGIIGVDFLFFKDGCYPYLYPPFLMFGFRPR